MGNFRTVMSIGLLSLAACGDDGGSGQPDAPKAIDAAVDAVPDAPADASLYDLSCLGNAAPTTIAPTVTISGTAQEVVIQGVTPAIIANPGVSIKACKGDCIGGNSLGTTTSSNVAGMIGTYSTVALTTGGVALEGYLDATKTGDRRTLVYPPSPLAQSQPGAPILMFSTAAVSALATVGINQDAAKGMLGIVVTDCANMPVTGAVVTVTQAGANVGDAPFDIGALAAQGAGTWLVTNVPVGDTTVTAKYGTAMFRAHVVSSVAGATTTTGVRPGF